MLIGMQLRHHPAMSYDGISNWPPTWTKSCGAAGSVDVLQGEVGTLRRVLPSRIEPCARLFLQVGFGGKSYRAILLFNAAAVCRYLTDVLQAYLGRTIKEIGDLELPGIP